MPRQPRARRAAAHDIVGQKGIKVVHRVDLRRSGRGPIRPEQHKPSLHLAEHETRLFPHGIGAGLAVAHRALGIAGAALARFAAAGDDEARCGVFRFNREAEGVKRGLAWRVDLRTDIAARHRIASSA